MSLFGPTRREIVDDAARVMELLEAFQRTEKACAIARSLRLISRWCARSRARSSAVGQPECT